MKLIFYLSLLFTGVLFSCSKSRTCTCISTYSSVKTTTARNNSAAIVESSSSPIELQREQTYPASTIKQMRRTNSCNSRTEFITRTYTTTITTGSNTNVVADVEEKNTNIYNCNIH